MTNFDYVTVGHVTVDVMLADGSRRPGGGAFYSALQAARLGLRTQILTQGVPRELEELLEPYREELDVRIFPAERTTTLATSGKGASRRQRMLAWAGPIASPVGVSTSILHFAPVARETPAVNRWRGGATFVGLTAQGLTREWDARGEISQVALDRARLAHRYDAIVISETERASCEWLLAEVGERGEEHKGRFRHADESENETENQDDGQRQERHEDAPIVVVTAGSKPITIYGARGTARTPSLRIEAPQDDLGAGDVFAAALFVALRDGLSATRAAAFGNAAAAVRIAGVGPNAVGDRAAIEALSARASRR
jgi:sugar/nucleoside kinase (ribokinase family)